MKKKILLLAAALMMFMGIVSASSINGDYKGNPIVKVMSNGKQLQSDEVPAQIYDGHTVVPISLLRQLGASVEWNQDTYSVDVKLPNQQQPVADNVNLANVMIGFNHTAKEYNASNVQLVFNELGGYIRADVKLTGDRNLDNQNIMLTSSFVANSPAAQIFINLYENNLMAGFYDIDRLQVESYIKKQVSADDFIKTWKWVPQNSNTAQPEQNENNSGSYTLNDAVNELGFVSIANMTVDARSLAIELVEVRKTKKQADYSVQNALLDLGIPLGSTPTLATLRQAVKLISIH